MIDFYLFFVHRNISTESNMENITENITLNDFHTFSMFGTIALSILRLIFEIIQMIRVSFNQELGITNMVL